MQAYELIKVILTQCKSLHHSYNTKNVWYINAPVHIALYIHVLRLRDGVFFFAYNFFEKKLCPPPPPHFSSLSYTIIVVQI